MTDVIAETTVRSELLEFATALHRNNSLLVEEKISTDVLGWSQICADGLVLIVNEVNLGGGSRKYVRSAVIGVADMEGNGTSVRVFQSPEQADNLDDQHCRWILNIFREHFPVELTYVPTPSKLEMAQC